MNGRKGDFAEAAEKAYSPLVRAATVLCWSEADVEDVVQETMLQALKSYGSFRGHSSFLTWAYAILARVAAAVNQKRSRSFGPEYAQSRPQDLPPVDAKVIGDERARLVVSAIRSLPQRQREMVTLHFLEELSYAEIAAALGVSVGTVKATIFAAKMSLRSILSERDMDGEVGNVVS